MTDRQKLPELGKDLSRNEIMEVLANDGYPAGRRKEWLNEVLTRLAKEQQEEPDANRAELVAEIKAILNDNVTGKSQAEDTL